MLFSYKGFDKKGQKVSSTIEATNIEEAKLKLKNKNIFCTKIKEKQMVSFHGISLNTKRISASKLSLFSRDLSMYLKSNISLVKALRLLKTQFKKDKTMKTFLEVIETYVDEGKDFYTSLEKQNVITLPEFYKQSIKVSESSGLLESVLLELSYFLKEQEKIKKQFSSAMAYPVFILIISFFMVAFMLSVVVPQITSIFEKQESELPTITSFVISLGDFVENNFILIILSIVIFIFSFIFMMRKSISFKYIIDQFMLRIPFFNSLVQLSDLSRFAYMNSILIRSGVPIVQSFKLSSNILKNSVLKKVFQLGSKKVVEGERLSKILEKNTYYDIDTTFVQAIAIGEETSQMPEVLNNLAELYNENNKDKISILLSLIEPLLMLIVGAIIGFIVLAMLLPIFSMNIS